MKFVIPIVLLASFLCSCTYYKPLYTKIPVNDTGVLLQETRGMVLYITVKKDSAFFERWQADKNSYFTDLDTLLRTGENEPYIGRYRQMILHDSSAHVTFLHGVNTNKPFIFSVSGKKGREFWNRGKNQIYFLYNFYGNATSSIGNSHLSQRKKDKLFMEMYHLEKKFGKEEPQAFQKRLADYQRLRLDRL